MFIRSEMFHLSQGTQRLTLVRQTTEGGDVYVGEVDGRPCVTGPSRHTTLEALLRHVVYRKIS